MLPTDYWWSPGRHTAGRGHERRLPPPRLLPYAASGAAMRKRRSHITHGCSTAQPSCSPPCSKSCSSLARTAGKEPGFDCCNAHTAEDLPGLHETGGHRACRSGREGRCEGAESPASRCAPPATPAHAAMPSYRACGYSTAGEYCTDLRRVVLLRAIGLSLGKCSSGKCREYSRAAHFHAMARRSTGCTARGRNPAAGFGVALRVQILGREHGTAALC